MDRVLCDVSGLKFLNASLWFWLIYLQENRVTLKQA